MKFVIQRVSQAEVVVEEQSVVKLIRDLWFWFRSATAIRKK